MADYKELLRKAIAALPENNGAARRAVYEKARTALVGQLRNLDPPLPARDITQHRLQLEDCIRQVEQEASESIINIGREDRRKPATAPSAEESSNHEPEPEAQRPPPAFLVPDDEQLSGENISGGEPAAEAAQGSEAEDHESVESIEAIIAAAESASDTEPRPHSRVVQREVAEAESDVGENDSGEAAPHVDAPQSTTEPAGAPTKPAFRLFPSLATRGAKSQPRMASDASPSSSSRGRGDFAVGGQAVARKQYPEEDSVEAPDQDVEAALSSVREVELEPDEADNAREAEGAIERAIQTLDREARGEVASTPETRTAGSSESVESEYAPVPTAEVTSLRGTSDTGPRLDEPALDEDSEPARGGGGLTIFLMVFVLLLAGVGGAGYWAWREGYVDLDQMFGRVADEAPAIEAVSDIDPGIPTLDSGPADEPPEEATGQPESGPGNTATEAVTPEPTTALEGIEPEEERLTPTEDAGEPLPEPVESDEGLDILDDERLPSADAMGNGLSSDPAASVDPQDLAGSQSLLLEAASDGRTGAVPFSGTVEWSRGTDELGMPTIQATASIPARNMDVEVTLRQNTDPSLPASHLMEVTFDVSDTFIGGSISALPGVLLKNEELMQGTPLAGASARVVGNSFLFALSESGEDVATNRDLLSSRKWMDLAVIYATGQRAIITLEKDDAAEELFDDVLASWEPGGDDSSEG